MTTPSARYERQSPYGLRIPDYDAAFDLQQDRPISDLSIWILQVIRMNGLAAQRDAITKFNQLVTPTHRKVPYLGFRTGSAPLFSATEPSFFAEIFTMPKDTPGGFDSVVRIHEAPATEQVHHLHVTVHERTVYSDVDTNEATATPLLRPLVQDVLKELGYGTPKSRFADVALLQQPHPEFRLVPTN